MELIESKDFACKWHREHPVGAPKMLLHNGEYYFCRTCDTVTFQRPDLTWVRGGPPIMGEVTS